MTDFELIALAGERLRLREAEAKASGNRKLLASMMKLHKALDKATKAYAVETGGDVVAFSGGTPKELPQ
jgi:hypothetical protein